MGQSLKLNLVLNSGFKELGVVEPPEVSLGRDPVAGGLRLDNPAVSRNHGIIFYQGRHWFYRDLGSTNGSWIDGRSVKDGLARVIRPGTRLQLADALLKVDAAESGARAFDAEQSISRSLIVFSAGELLSEFAVPEYGRALSVGGRTGDLELPGDLFEMPSLILERRGDRICASRVVKDTPAIINGQNITEPIELTDGDYISIGEYEILVNDPGLANPSAAPESQIDMEGGAWTSSAEEPSVSRPSSSRITFGQFGTIAPASPSDFELNDLGADADSGRMASDRRRATRVDLGTVARPASSVEDKILVASGFLMLGILIAFALWFFLS